MKTAFGLISATRWPMAILTALLTITSFHLRNLGMDVIMWPMITAAVITAATMIINDIVDRKRDFAQDHRRFTTYHLREMIILAIFLWSVAIGFSLRFGILGDFRAMWLSLAMCLLGFVYSWTRNIPALPMLIVAFTSSLAACYPEINYLHDLLFPLIVDTTIMGREILKDCEDVAADLDPVWGKKTLPILWGTESAMTFARGCFIVSGILLLQLARTNSVVAVVLGIGIAAYIIGPKTIKKAKMILDVSMFAFLGGMSTKPSVFVCAAVISTNDKKDAFVEIRRPQSNKTVWVAAYCCFVVVVLALGSFRSFGQSLIISLIGLVGLAGLQFTGAYYDYDPGYSAQKIKVERMIMGMAIGLIASMLSMLGIPLLAIALIWPIVLIIIDITSKEVMIMRDHATLVGIVVISSLVSGLHVIFQIAFAYAVVVIIYYCKMLKSSTKSWKNVKY